MLINKELTMYKVIIYVDGLLAMEKTVDTYQQAKSTVYNILQSIQKSKYKIIKL